MSLRGLQIELAFKSVMMVPYAADCLILSLTSKEELLRTEWSSVCHREPTRRLDRRLTVITTKATADLVLHYCVITPMPSKLWLMLNGMLMMRCTSGKKNLRLLNYFESRIHYYWPHCSWATLLLCRLLVARIREFCSEYALLLPRGPIPIAIWAKFQLVGIMRVLSNWTSLLLARSEWPNLYVWSSDLITLSTIRYTSRARLTLIRSK